jgi:hypothetical protein
MMTQLAVKKTKRGQGLEQDVNAPRNMGQFITGLLDLTRDAENLRMHRVVLCLQYAYWEALCDGAPTNPLN